MNIKWMAYFVSYQVIQEIDDMMQDSSPSCDEEMTEHNEALEKGKEVLSSPLYEDSESQCFLFIDTLL